MEYHAMTVPPTFPERFSGRLAAPAISEKRMMGYTTAFSIATSTEPKGETHEIVFLTVSSPQNAER